jgi:hypothetical protein
MVEAHQIGTIASQLYIDALEEGQWYQLNV